MKTNSKQVREQIKKHLLEICNDYDENNFNDFATLKAFIKDCFIKEYYQHNKNKNIQSMFSEWLTGLPSVINIFYYYDDVKKFLNGLGINPQNKKFDDNKSMDLYCYLIYREIYL